MTVYLTQQQLSERWVISGRTLEGWRFREDNGPGWVRIGRSVRYPLEAVERFERENFRDIIQYRRNPHPRRGQDPDGDGEPDEWVF